MAFGISNLFEIIPYHSSFEKYYTTPTHGSIVHLGLSNVNMATQTKFPAVWRHLDIDNQHVALYWN